MPALPRSMFMSELGVEQSCIYERPLQILQRGKFELVPLFPMLIILIAEEL